DPRRSTRCRAGAPARAHQALRLAGTDPRRRAGGVRGRAWSAGEDRAPDLRGPAQGGRSLGFFVPLEGAAQPRAEAAFHLRLVAGTLAHLRIRLRAHEGAAEAGAEPALGFRCERLLVEAAGEREP